jgi:hypothetical protein
LQNRAARINAPSPNSSRQNFGKSGANAPPEKEEHI